jgi:hypothetical protein
MFIISYLKQIVKNANIAVGSAAELNACRNQDVSGTAVIPPEEKQGGCNVRHCRL